MKVSNTRWIGEGSPMILKESEVNRRREVCEWKGMLFIIVTVEKARVRGYI